MVSSQCKLHSAPPPAAPPAHCRLRRPPPPLRAASGRALLAGRADGPPDTLVRAGKGEEPGGIGPGEASGRPAAMARLGQGDARWIVDERADGTNVRAPGARPPLERGPVAVTQRSPTYSFCSWDQLRVNEHELLSKGFEWASATFTVSMRKALASAFRGHLGLELLLVLVRVVAVHAPCMRGVTGVPHCG